MKISQILAQERHDAIRIYKQDVFWMAYEQSAHHIWKQKVYKPQCIFVKDVNQFVVSLGFPEYALQAWQDENLQYPQHESKNCRLHSLKFPLSQADFALWKDDMKHTQIINGSKDEMIEKINLTKLIRNTVTKWKKFFY